MSPHLDDLTLSRLVDGDVSLVAREAAFDHLRRCSACAARHDQLVAAVAALREMPPARWSPGQSDMVAARLGERPVRVPVRPLALGAGLLAAATLSVAAVPALLSAPTLSLTVRVMGALIPGGALASGSGMLLALAVIAVAAPLAALPLARWR
jgi:anti-sigma factor RsiW